METTGKIALSVKCINALLSIVSTLMYVCQACLNSFCQTGMCMLSDRYMRRKLQSKGHTTLNTQDLTQ